MKIEERITGRIIEYNLEGRIDVNESKLLEEELSNKVNSFLEWTIYLDFSKVEFISSAGIRVLLTACKNLKSGHKLIIRNPSEFCRNVFQVTGADIFLTIE